MILKLNAPQTRFLLALEKHRFILFGAGVGTGKTFLISVVAALLAEKNAGLPGIVASHLHNHLKVELLPQLLAVLRASGLFQKHRKQDRVIELVNGSSIQYGSADNPSSLEGRNAAWGLGDELRFWSLQAYRFFVARVRIREAPMPRVCGFTTLETHWLQDEWRDRDGRHVVYATTFENAKNLRQGYIDDLETSLSPQMFDLYVNAKWVSSSASVYGKVYSKKDHVQDDLYVPNHPVIGAIDFGVVAPAWLFLQHFDWCERHQVAGCMHVIDELNPDDTALRELIVIARKLERKKGYIVRDVYVDPAGKQRDQIYGETAVHTLEESGYNVWYSTSSTIRSIRVGIEIVASRLLNARGQRRLFFDKNLDKRDLAPRGIIRAMDNYRYPERKAGRPIDDSPAHDEYSHVQDALRYSVVNLFPPSNFGIS